MRLRSTLRTLSILTLALAFAGSSPSTILAKRHHGGGDKPVIVKADPKPLADTGKSGFAKLVVRNLGPLVNSSDLDFTPVVSGPDEGIRFGLGAIKNVGANAVESIATARALKYSLPSSVIIQRRRPSRFGAVSAK